MIAEADVITDSLFNNICLLCSERCKTCVEEADRCTSCYDDKVLNGSTCIDKTVVRMVHEINIEFTAFLEGGKSQILI